MIYNRTHAIITSPGLFDTTCIRFRPYNAASAFQRVIDEIKGQPFIYALVDAILASTMLKNKQSLQRKGHLLKCFFQLNLCRNTSKYMFGIPRIDISEHRVSEN